LRSLSRRTVVSSLRVAGPDSNGRTLSFTGVNVLEDDAIRQGVKKFSNWPTIPQLYVKREFVGGCDIVREMYQSGELQKLLQDEGVTVGK
jgi:monothiol glutaredoxin